MGYRTSNALDTVHHWERHLTHQCWYLVYSELVLSHPDLAAVPLTLPW